MIKYRLGCLLTAVTLGTGLVGAASASAEGAADGQGKQCHAYVLQLSKSEAGALTGTPTNSLAATAAAFGVSVQAGQEVIASDCLQS